MTAHRPLVKNAAQWPLSISANAAYSNLHPKLLSNRFGFLNRCIIRLQLINLFSIETEH